MIASEYRIAVVDPPWLERGGGKIKRGADRHYPLMKTDDICELLHVGNTEGPLADMLPISAMFLWVTNNFLPDGLRVMEVAGYRYVTMLTWAKDRFGLGYYFRGQTEHVLFGVRGKWSRPPGTSSTLLGGGALPRTRHSAKPPQLQDMIEERFEGPYLELFARGQRSGWTAWGNEIPGSA